MFVTSDLTTNSNNNWVIKPPACETSLFQGLAQRLCFYQPIKQFSTNVPLTDKPGSWFLLAKCHSSTGVFQTFCVTFLYKWNIDRKWVKNMIIK